MTASKTLMLNSHWQPIDIIPATNAIKKVFGERAKCLDTKDYVLKDWQNWLNSFNKKNLEWYNLRNNIPIPEIIVCTEYSGTGYQKDYEPKFSRTNIFLRDKNRCQFCGEKFPCNDLTLGHIIPKSKGGPSTWLNIALQCINCNRKMADRTPKEAGMTMIRKPFVPNVKDLQLTGEGKVVRKISRIFNREKYPPAWNNFISKKKLDEVASYVYWNIDLEKE